MHYDNDEKGLENKKIMDLDAFKKEVWKIYNEMAGDAKLIMDPTVQPEMRRLISAYQAFVAIPPSLPVYPLLLSVSSTRLRQLVQDRYAVEYELYVERSYNCRWGNFAIDAGFSVFNYDSILLEAEPGLGSYLSSDDQRCYLPRVECAVTSKWHPAQLALYVQLSDTALGIIIMRQLQCSTYIVTMVSHALKRVANEVQTSLCISKSAAPRIAQSFSILLQDIPHEEMISLAVIAKEIATILTQSNPTLRAISHRQLAATINPTLMWMVEHEPGELPKNDNEPTTTKSTGKPMTEVQIRALFKWSIPWVKPRCECTHAI
ncbi:unnamed protein product [Phytomonas sp. EM1]|nr:unnamed protein product [Phytomonas sp. EM1]|eukprot:CCW65083.1 unnamed protein product [Phytomonas sp. isolate EM1]